MTFWILANTVGEAITTTSIEGTTGTTTTSSGYDINKIVSGPRHNRWRCNSVTSMVGAGYKSSADLTARFVALARADLLLRNQNGVPDVDIRKWNGSSWSTINTLSGLALADLIGIKGQDYVFDFGDVTDRGFGLQFQVSGGATLSAHAHGPMYFSSGFDFGTPPRLDSSPAQFGEGAETEEVRPAFGYGTYAVEGGMSLVWRNITRAKMVAFRALPLGSPLFLYDPSQYIFHHKLEHVLISESPIESRHGVDAWDLRVNFKRLQQYDV